MSVPDWRQPRGLRGRPGFKPTCRAEFAAWTASGQASVPVGGGRAWPGFETTRQANDQQPSAGGVEAATGPAGPGLGAGGRRQGQGGLSGRAKLRPVGGCRGACGAWPRCRRAAAGPGRASRRRAKRTISNQAPSVWRPPRGLQGLAGLRDDAPSEARGADGERAGRPRGGRKSGSATNEAADQRCHKRRPKVRTPRSTPGSGRPGGRRGDRAR